MSFGIRISSGKTGQGGTNAGWRVVKELYEWDCPCGTHVAKHWTKCPKCALHKPERVTPIREEG